jgi:acyl-CoA synthetase (AMP-forming)/AMP-acid ligase II
MRNLSIQDIFSRNAALYADRPALIDAQATITFRELQAQAEGLAAGLHDKGVKRGDRVAVLAYNRCEWFWLMGAAARLGAIVVPLNWRLASEELAFILTDAEPTLLVFDEAHASLAAELTTEARQAPASLPLEKLDTLVAPRQLPPSQTEGDLPFVIIYTAAVDGTPRGAVLSHHNFVFSNLQTIATLLLDPKDVNLNLLPLFHITGLNLALAAMQAGGVNVIMPRFDAAQALDWTAKAGVTLMGSFPPILSKLLEEQQRRPRALASLKHVMGLDAPATIEAFEQATGATFWTLYGQTETSGFVTLAPLREKPGSAGRQGLLSRFRLVDEEDRDVPLGSKGEIVVQGPLVFQGFWGREEHNARLFRSGWHHTGDLGHLDPEGYLWFGGRKPEKELIKPGGENVYPAEVEAVIREHADVSEVTVIGVPDPQFGEGVKAVCVLQPGASLTGEALSEFVAARIARYKKPRYVEFVAELPHRADGSVDRAEVKRRYGQS